MDTKSRDSYLQRLFQLSDSQVLAQFESELRRERADYARLVAGEINRRMANAPPAEATQGASIKPQETLIFPIGGTPQAQQTKAA